MKNCVGFDNNFIFVSLTNFFNFFAFLVERMSFLANPSTFFPMSISVSLVLKPVISSMCTLPKNGLVYFLGRGFGVLILVAHIGTIAGGILLSLMLRIDLLAGLYAGLRDGGLVAGVLTDDGILTEGGIFTDGIFTEGVLVDDGCFIILGLLIAVFVKAIELLGDGGDSPLRLVEIELSGVPFDADNIEGMLDPINLDDNSELANLDGLLDVIQDDLTGSVTLG